MAKTIIIENIEVFNAQKALNGASLGFVTKNASSKYELVQYITNFTLKKKSSTNEIYYTGIGSEDGEVYTFDAKGQTKSKQQLYILVDKISSSTDTTGGTRVDSTEGTSYNISTLLPKDQIAAQVLNGILSRMTLEEIEALSPARINQLSSQAYKMAQSMINTAVVFRDKFGAVKPEGGGGGTTEVTTPTDNTEKFLDNISKSIDNLQKKSQATNSGVFLNNTEAKPLYVKTISSGGGSGEGGEISGSITANVQGDIGLANASSQSALRVTGNSTIGGGQNNLPIIIDAPSQNTLGAIPISIKGGLVGEWRMKDSTTKYSVSKIALNSSAFNIALNTADNSELIVGLSTATADHEGLMSDVDYKDLDILRDNVGTKYFKLGSNTYTTLQEALDAINTRLVALENK